MSTDSVEYRALIRQSLVRRFSLAEMKELAFDLGVSYDAFPHLTAGEFALELVGYFERRGRIRALVRKMLELRPDPSLGRLLTELPGSDFGYVIIEMRIDAPSLENSSAWKAGIATKLGIEVEDIHILAMAAGSVHLLVGLPAEVAEAALQLGAAAQLGADVVQSTDPFPLSYREAWRLVALDWPPQRAGEALRPTISWKDASDLGQFRHGARMLQVDTATRQLLPWGRSLWVPLLDEADTDPLMRRPLNIDLTESARGVLIHRSEGAQGRVSSGATGSRGPEPGGQSGNELKFMVSVFEIVEEVLSDWSEADRKTYFEVAYADLEVSIATATPAESVARIAARAVADRMKHLRDADLTARTGREPLEP